MIKFSLVITCVAIISLRVYAFNDIECEVQENEHWNDPGFSDPDKPRYTTYYVCSFGENVAISNHETKLKNQRNQNVSEFLGREINGLEYLPVDIVDAFPEVRKVSFIKTPLKSISKRNFHGLANLGFLDIDHNEISSIAEDTFDDLGELFRLSLNNNKLTSLPAKVFSKLSKLDTLYLSGNQLTSLDAGMFKDNYNLGQLLLDENQLTTIEPGFLNSQGLLRALWLNDNKITALNHDLLKNCGRLSSLRLENNKINKIPIDLIANCPGLHDIYFSNNPISTIDFAMFGNNKQLLNVHFDNIKVEKVLNINMVEKMTHLWQLTFEVNGDSCVIGKFHGGNLDKFKQEVQENCKTE